MLNNFKRNIVYLDPETLRYMYYSYSKNRNYPVMNKLFALLSEGYRNNLVITPICLDHILPFIKENTINPDFLNMMGSMGQVQFYQRFTIRTLQLIRIINHFFHKRYNKPNWRDAFSSDPDERYVQGFNQYISFSAQNVTKGVAREKHNSQIFFFINSFKEGKELEETAPAYFKYLWQEFPDLIKPYLPRDGDSEYQMKKFFEYDEIKDIPEFHVIGNVLYPLFETYGIHDIENGMKDDLLNAAESMAAIMPYTHYYVSTAEIAEIAMMTGVNEPYNTKIYDHNESSLYKMINDLQNDLQTKKSNNHSGITRSSFRKPRF